MKNIIILYIFILLPILCMAQKAELNGTEIRPYNVHITGLDQFAAEKPKGSQYIQPNFAQAKVDGIEKRHNMRYNAYRDEFEFLGNRNDTLAVDKSEDFGTITFAGSNKKYKLVTYDNSVEKSHRGYLIEMYQKENYALYKRECVLFYAGKKAKTTLEKDMPAKFIKQDDSYYLKDNKGNITDFPESKKQLIKLFPDKKDKIEAFVKESKVTFDDDAGRIQIINFLASL